MTPRFSRPIASLTSAALITLISVAPVLGQSPSPGPSAVASTVPGASPGLSRSDPRCDPFLATDDVEATLGDLTVMSVEYFEDRPAEPLGHFTCTWVPGPGEQEVWLDVDDLAWSGEPFMIAKHAGGTPVPDLGIEAYEVVEGGSRYLAWAEHLGDVDRTLILYGYDRPYEPLFALARMVNGDATPGAAPSAPPPATPPADARAILGTWLVTGWSEGDLPAKPPVTVAFGSDGTVVFTADCKPAKGSKKPVKRTTFTVDGAELDVAPGSWIGACRSNTDRDFLQMFGFVSSLATQPGTWSIDGDVLTIDGAAPGSLTLTRQTVP